MFRANKVGTNKDIEPMARSSEKKSTIWMVHHYRRAQVLATAISIALPRLINALAMPAGKVATSSRLS